MEWLLPGVLLFVGLAILAAVYFRASAFSFRTASILLYIGCVLCLLGAVLFPSKAHAAGIEIMGAYATTSGNTVFLYDAPCKHDKKETGKLVVTVSPGGAADGFGCMYALNEVQFMIQWQDSSISIVPISVVSWNKTKRTPPQKSTKPAPQQKFHWE